jgi:hypothetical protein
MTTSKSRSPVAFVSNLLRDSRMRYFTTRGPGAATGAGDACAGVSVGALPVGVNT